MVKKLKIGSKVRANYCYITQFIYFNLTVTHIEGDLITLSVPESVSSLPYPPYDGRKAIGVRAGHFSGWTL